MISVLAESVVVSSRVPTGATLMINDSTVMSECIKAFNDLDICSAASRRLSVYSTEHTWRLRSGTIAGRMLSILTWSFRFNVSITSNCFAT